MAEFMTIAQELRVDPLNFLKKKQTNNFPSQFQIALLGTMVIA